MFKLIENRPLVPNLHMLRVEAPEVARSVQPGQFVIVRVEEDGERIPLSVADWDSEQGTITLIYMTIGATTHRLSRLPAGDGLPTVAGPLGNAMEIDHFGSVVCVGGCYGIGSIYPIARALREIGNTVTIIIEARSSYLLYWQEKLKQVSDRLIVITRDGSGGLKGHIDNLPAIIERLPQRPQRVIANGCNFLMMRASEQTRPLAIPTIVSLNTLMIDGTGMCGVCRVTVDDTVKFACVDGPHFDGHKVDWAELNKRRQAYLREETIPLRSSAGTAEQ
ncbi:MAG: sulfide/dihydroorotate dehydrogenase-like FAD/NAD-binding protein [Anaerolineae bacterium]|nr:sulfide/dihydroorotate dehydrogenase-like FAD/NAD-binding protein [Anaerolineae bacterium]